MRLLGDVFNTPRMDCTSMSLQAQANGLYTLSFKVYYKRGLIPYTKDNTIKFTLCVAKQRRFTGIVTQQQVSPSVEFKDVVEWSVTAIGFVCFDDACYTNIRC